MSAAEFMNWQAILRRKPQGHHWQNYQVAFLAREMEKSVLRSMRSKQKPRPLDHFMWKPPEPLFVTREKAKAKRKARRG